MENLDHIIVHCIEQKRSAQEELYAITYRELCAAVAVYVNDHSERDWVFNLGMMKVFTNLKNYKLGTNYLGWARVILVRSAIDHIRSRIKHTVNLAPVHIGHTNLSSSDFENMMDEIDTEEIMLLIQKLPESERLIFNLYEIEGYTHKEIEKLTEIKSNTSKWLLSKAKKALRGFVSISSELKSCNNEK